MTEVADTEVKELISSKQETSTSDSLPGLIPFGVYQKDGLFKKKNEYLQIANGVTKDTKFDPIHINQAEAMAKYSKLLPEEVRVKDAPKEIRNVLRVYALLRDKGRRVNEISQAKQLAEERNLPYHENEPVLGPEETSIGKWSLGNNDKVVFAEALRLTLGQKAYLHYASQYPNIFKTKT